MSVRRKQRNTSKKQKLSKKTQTKSKKKKRKRKCCVSCWCAICKWCCKRFKRCVTKKVFGVPETRWGDYDFAGVDLESLKDKFAPGKKRSSLRKNATIMTLYKNGKPFSKTNISLRHLDLIEGLEADDLKQKFSITGSKGKILEQLVEDYKKGNLSSSGMSKKSKFHFKKLDKDQLNKLLDTYTQKKLNERKSLNDINFDDIKRRLSIIGSKGRALDKLIADYQRGNISKSALSNIRKLDLKNPNKKKVSDILRDLKQHQTKNRKDSFTGLSKVKEVNSLSRLKNVLKM